MGSERDAAAGEDQHPSFGSRAPLLAWWLVLAALLAYHAIGFVPLAPVEGDAEAIANSAELMVRQGLGPGESLAYRYSAQPGVYLVLTALGSSTGWSCLTVFALLSALASVVLTILCAVLVAEILSVPVPVAGLGAIAFQETLASGCYANSSVLAAALAVAALVVLARGTGWTRMVAGGALLACAGLCRADAVLLAPVCCLLVLGRRPAAGLRRVLCLAAAAVVVFSVGFLLAGGSLGEVVMEAARHVGQGHGGTRHVPWLFSGQVLRSHVAFFPLLAVFLVGVGCADLIRDRRWDLLGISALGFLPLYAVYARALSSPKYLLYAVPFVVLPAVYGLVVVRRSRRLVWAVAAVLFLGQYLVGVRILLRSKPWAGEPGPPGLVVCSHEPAGGPVSRFSIAFGPGTLIPTDDGPRLAGGTLFSPLVWHRHKAEMRANLSSLRHYLDRAGAGRLDLVSTTWFARNLVNRLLLDGGFAYVRGETLPPPDAFRYHWRRGGQVVVHSCCETYSYDWADRQACLDLAGSRPVVMVIGAGRERQMALDHLGVDEVVCDSVGVTCLAAYVIRSPSRGRR